jgi:hypothetical protein
VILSPSFKDESTNRRGVENSVRAINFSAKSWNRRGTYTVRRKIVANFGARVGAAASR